MILLLNFVASSSNFLDDHKKKILKSSEFFPSFCSFSEKKMSCSYLNTPPVCNYIGQMSCRPLNRYPQVIFSLIFDYCNEYFIVNFLPDGCTTRIYMLVRMKRTFFERDYAPVFTSSEFTNSGRIIRCLPLIQTTSLIINISIKMRKYRTGCCSVGGEDVRCTYLRINMEEQQEASALLKCHCSKNVRA